MYFVLSLVIFKRLCDIVFMKSDILAWWDNFIEKQLCKQLDRQLQTNILQRPP
jgi:hypothetical protein